MDSQTHGVLDIPLGSQDLQEENFSPNEFEKMLENDPMWGGHPSIGQEIVGNSTTPLSVVPIQGGSNVPRYEASVEQAMHQPTLPSPEQTVPSWAQHLKTDDLATHESMGYQQELVPAAGYSALAAACPPPPPPQPGPPDQTILPGDYNFGVKMVATNSNKKCLFSKPLNKVYVGPNSEIPIDFTWDAARAGGATMYVRASVVFVDSEHAGKPVHACRQHREDHVDSRYGLNVLHSCAVSGPVWYEGGEATNHWLSVAVALPPAAPPKHTYRFQCRNSCSTGIDRRAIGILFVLLDSSGIVRGRQLMNARVCSCPVRDRRNDEKRLTARRPAADAPPPPAAPTPAKKVKLEPRAADADRDRVYVLPPLRVVGVRPLVAGLQTALHVMQAAPPTPDTPACVADFRRALAELRRGCRDLDE